MRNYIFGFILGAIIISFISVYATSSYIATQIDYKGETLDDVLDDLYDKSNNDYTIKKVASYASNGGNSLINYVELPDLSDYSILKIGRIIFNSATYGEIKLKKGNSDYCTFQNIVGEQECDISLVFGEGYYLVYSANNVANYQSTNLYNITLIK